MNKVLLISNINIGDSESPKVRGRTEKFLTRKRLLEDHGWEVTNCYIKSGKSVLRILKCLLIAIKNDFEVVNSVSEPFYLHLIGYLVSKLTRTPWLTEFRDPMIVNKPMLDENPWEKKIREKTETFIVKRTDQVVWDDGIQIPDEYFSETYPNVPQDKWFKLPYIGFENKKFEETPAMQYDKFTITYAGSFYKGWIEPTGFIKGLSRYVSENNDSDLQVQFYGDWSDEYEKLALEVGVKDIISTYEWVPHNELIPILKGSDLLLHVGGTDPRNRNNIPSKVYDYIGAKTPILALVDPSFRVAEVIENNHLGIAVEPNKPEKISQAIDQVRRGTIEYAPDEGIIETFSRNYRIKIFSEVLESVSRRKKYHHG